MVSAPTACCLGIGRKLVKNPIVRVAISFYHDKSDPRIDPIRAMDRVLREVTPSGALAWSKAEAEGGRMHVPLVRSTKTRRALGVGAGALLCLAMLPGAGAAAAKPGAKPAPGAVKEAITNYDSRTAGPARKVLEARSALAAAHPSNGVKNLRQELGMQGIVELDGLTGTPRRVTKIDGFLTGPSKAAPAKIALDYVRARADVFGLNAAQVDGLTLRNSYIDVEGTVTSASCSRSAASRCSTTASRRTSPRTADSSRSTVRRCRTCRPASGLRASRATAARDKAVEDTFGTSKATVDQDGGLGQPQDRLHRWRPAQLVLFQTLSGLQLGWQTITMKEGYLHVIDAKSGRTLFRQSIVVESTTRRPGELPERAQGRRRQERQPRHPNWLPNNSPRLAGNVAHVYKDVNDNDIADPSEEVPPSGNKSFEYPLQPLHRPRRARLRFVCSWDPDVPFSWQTNAKQNAVQLF